MSDTNYVPLTKIVTRTTFMLFAGMLMACGGGRKPATQPAPEKVHAHAKLPTSVDSFHDVLSPIWHAEPGAVRIQTACDQVTTLNERATALVTDPPPPEIGDKVDVWKVATTELAGQVGALATACAAPGQHDVEDKLAAVHEGFHKVGLTVSEMGDHGDNRPPGGTGQHGEPGEY